MFDLDSWQELAHGLGRNKLRALLTALGVFWGIFVLIVMLGIGRGLERGSRRNLGLMETRAVFVWADRTSLPYRGLSPGRWLRFEDADLEAVRSVRGVEHVAPRLRLGGWRDGASVTAGHRSSYFPVLGDVPELLAVEPLTLRRGRFINALDVREARKIAVIGDEARSILFGDEDPLGRTIQIRGVHFQVVGEVASERGGEAGERLRSSVFVPFTTFQRTFDHRNRVGWFALTARADAPADAVEATVRRVLAERHRVHPDDTQAIGSWNAAVQYGKIQGLFGAIRAFVWFVGTLTLLAGVLGVSNILLITVKERTREFGVRKALGATPAAVVSMVIREALALTLVSGYLGLVSGVLVLELIGAATDRLPNAPIYRPEIDFGAALVATVVLCVAGAAAGLVPARHAARISPVEALRAE
ncbi:MAG: ABC transporter permease [Pseudomonadota bacterium]